MKMLCVLVGVVVLGAGCNAKTDCSPPSSARFSGPAIAVEENSADEEAFESRPEFAWAKPAEDEAGAYRWAADTEYPLSAIKPIPNNCASPVLILATAP